MLRKADNSAPSLGLSRWLLTTILVVWAFILGVLVGQGTLANQEQLDALARVAGLESFFHQEDIMLQASEQLVKDYSFYEALEKDQAQVVSKAKPQAKAKSAKGTIKPAKKPEPKGGYAVQVASFKRAEQARQLKDKLAGVGYSAFIMEIDLKDLGKRYRVRVGPFADQATAKQKAVELGNKHQLATYLVRNPQ